MNVLVFGATGMVGAGVLAECLEDPRVQSILVVGRSACGVVNGKTENRLLQLPLNAYMFRPGYIQPLNGIRSKTTLYRAVYNVLGPLYPWIERVFPKHVTATVNLGRAMIQVAANGYGKRVLENPDINGLA